MDLTNQESSAKETETRPKRPLLATVLAIMLALIALGALAGGIYGAFSPQGWPSGELNGQLVLTGSTSTLPLLEKLAAAFTEQQPAVMLQAQSGSVETALAAVNDGAAGLAGVGRPLTDEEKSLYPDLRVTAVAVDGLAIIVNKDVTLSTLSLAQLQAIFAGEVTNFADVGGPDMPVALVSPAADTEPRAVFESLVMADKSISDQALTQPTADQVRQTVAVVPHAIGFVPLAALDGSTPVVPLDNVAPQVDTVRNQTYPLRYTLNLVTKARANPLAGALVNFAFSSAGQTAIAESYLPLTRPLVILDVLQTLLVAVILAGLGLLVARGLWTLQNWARIAVIFLLTLALIYVASSVIFQAAAQIFGGAETITLGKLAQILGMGLLNVALYGLLPGLLMWGLMRLEPHFKETPGQRRFTDTSMRYILNISALSAVFIVFLIIVFTMLEAWSSIEEIGVGTMLIGTIWRPGDLEFGVMPMIIGSVFSTIGAIILGVPLSLGCAILLAEIAPKSVWEVLHPAVELLAGIPSVVYGLFGMVVLAPVIRSVELPYNTGFGLLNASIILAVMILPTVATISEDAIRAVPKAYKEGSLALGATHWQTIWSVLLPAGRSGIMAAIILGIGRALGETMALIMVIGNSIAMPAPLNDNPLTLMFSTARTLTGNIAVEINYATGVHKSSLFFTGVLLLAMILSVDLIAKYLMKERLSS